MKKLLTLSFLFILQNCTKVIEIDIPQDNPRQVLNCLFTENKPFKVRLTKSVGMLDDFSTPIDNATVVLYENNIAVETLNYANSYYTSQLTAQPNKNYKISSSATGFEQINAQNTIPAPPIITNVSLIEEAYFDTTLEGFFGQLNIIIEDDIVQNNYYELEIIRTYYFMNGNEEEYIVGLTGIEFCSDPIIMNEIDEQSISKGLVFTDESFNGTSSELQFDFINHYNDDDTPISYKVVLRSITEDYYRYKKRLNKHTHFREGEIWDVLIEPIQMYSNIEEGYGIFAGYNENSIEF